MYLGELEVKNFRCLKDLSVRFSAGLNVIVGENNTGKSALIDALRLLFGLGSQRRDIFFSEDDLHHDDQGNPTSDWCEIHATLRGLSTAEQGGFVRYLVAPYDDGAAQVHLRYQLQKGSVLRRSRLTVWGGEHPGEGVDFQDFDGLFSVYLEPLRDAQVGLRPGRNSRISRLLQILSSGEDQQQQLTNIVKEAHRDIENHDLLQLATGHINEGLRRVSGDVYAQRTDLRLTEPTFKRITESLRARIGTGNLFEIEENGLGFNNLLYIATVLSELQHARARKAEEVDLATLLIEEPEAHLHPQLQTVLVDYLEDVSNNQANQTSAEDKEGTSLPVQIFVTTHSPTLAARVEPDSLNVLYFGHNSSPHCFALKESQLNSEEKRKLRRFLDVTKAQLFFGKALIMVEGISEAMLLPVLACRENLNLDEHRICVVNLQSTAFDPFAKLFWEGCLGLRAAIVTDADPADVYPDQFDSNQMSGRAQKIKELENGTVKVFFAAKTFEYDLALAGNAEFMARQYQQLRPGKGKKMIGDIAKAQTPREKAEAFSKEFDPKDKAVFAQSLAESLIENDSQFQVPEYLRKAMRYAAGSSDDNGC